MHYEISSDVNASNIKPLSPLFYRTTEEGDVGISCFLIGSEFNNDSKGEIIEFENGNILESVTDYANGKMYLYGKPEIDNDLIEIGGAHSTFAYLFPGTEIFGHMGIRNKVAEFNLQGDLYKQYGRTVFEDLNTGNQIIIELKISRDGPELSFIEKIDNVEYILGDIIVDDYDIYFDLKFLEQGVTSFGYTIDKQEIINVFKGDLNFNFSACKVFHAYYTNYVDNINYLATDFIRIDYDTLFTSYKSALIDKVKASTKVYDIVIKDCETIVSQIRSRDHKVLGNIQISNSIIRATFYNNKINIEGYNNGEWKNLGKIIPSLDSVKSTTLIDYKIKTLSSSNIVIEVQYDTCNYLITLRKGMSWIKIKPDNKELLFEPDQNDFGLNSSDNSKLSEYNIEHRKNNLSLKNGITNLNIDKTDNSLSYMNDNWVTFYGINDQIHKCASTDSMNSSNHPIYENFFINNIDVMTKTFDVNIKINTSTSQYNTSGQSFIDDSNPYHFYIIKNDGSEKLIEATLLLHVNNVYTFQTTEDIKCIQYIGYKNPNDSNTVTFIGSYYIPHSIELNKQNIINNALIKWIEPNVFGIGFVPITLPDLLPIENFFNNTQPDKSIKWKANTCIFDFKQVKKVNSK